MLVFYSQIIDTNCSVSRLSTRNVRIMAGNLPENTNINLKAVEDLEAKVNLVVEGFKKARGTYKYSSMQRYFNIFLVKSILDAISQLDTVNANKFLDECLGTFLTCITNRCL